VTNKAHFNFRLYVADDAENSAQAVANLKAFCRIHLADRHAIEVIDVFREPKRAMADRVLMTPTLIKLSPMPIQRIIGTLSQPHILSQALALEVA
jgi:circadian clock protein KaiB